MPKPVKKKRSGRRHADPNVWARRLVDESTDEPEATPTISPAALSAYMSALGRKGGQVSGARRKKNLSPERRSAIALKAAMARWKDKP
jgi:hypothetical protein